MSTRAYFTVDGMPKHEHGGVKGFHSPHIRHADAGVHAAERAAQPKYAEGATDELKARYKEALAGKSFEYLWAPGREARRAARVAAGGPEWVHHGSGKAATEAVKEAEEALVAGRDQAEFPLELR